MQKKHSRIINKSKLLKKLAAVLSLFAISAAPAEAARSPKTKKTIVRHSRSGIAKRSLVRSKTTRARASAKRASLTARKATVGTRKAAVRSRLAVKRVVAPVSVRRVSLRGQQQAAAALAQQQAAAALAQQQAAAALAQQQEAARQAQIAAIRQARQEERRLLVAGKGNFDARPFAKKDCERTYGGGGIAHRFQICDLGYEAVPGHAAHTARTAQYTRPGNIANAMNLPATPVFHPYHPDAGNDAVVLSPLFLLNIKEADYQDLLALAPPAIQAFIRNHLVGIADYNIEGFTVAQDLDRWAGAGLQFKPQYWLEPDAPYDSPQAYGGPEHTYTVEAGVFAAHDPNIRLQGQAPGTLVEERDISIHNDAPGTPLVSSGSVLNLENFPRNISQILWSVAKYTDKVTGDKRVAFGRNVFLKSADMEAAVFLLNNAAAGHNWGGTAVQGGAADLNDLGRKITALRALPPGNPDRRFEDLDLAELF